MINTDDIIDVLQKQQEAIRDKNATIRLFAAYLIIAADKGALEQENHAVIEAKRFLRGTVVEQSQKKWKQTPLSSPPCPKPSQSSTRLKKS